MVSRCKHALYSDVIPSWAVVNAKRHTCEFPISSSMVRTSSDRCCAKVTGLPKQARCPPPDRLDIAGSLYRWEDPKIFGNTLADGNPPPQVQEEAARAEEPAASPAEERTKRKRTQEFYYGQE